MRGSNVVVGFEPRTGVDVGGAKSGTVIARCLVIEFKPVVAMKAVMLVTPRFSISRPTGLGNSLNCLLVRR